MRWAFLALAVIIIGVGIVATRRVEWVARNEYPGVSEYRLGAGLPWSNLLLPWRGIVADKGRVYPRKVQVLLWDKVVNGCREYKNGDSKQGLLRGMLLRQVGEAEILVYLYASPEAISAKYAGAETARYAARCLKLAEAGELPEELAQSRPLQGLLVHILPMEIAYAR